MNILFVHQNFPGQYRHVASALADDPANQVLAIGEAGNVGRMRHPRIRELGYPSPEPAGPQTHHYVRSFEAAVRRGQQVVRVAQQLQRDGYRPDIVCCHPAWGEGLYLRDVWPDTVLLYFFEFFYHAKGHDTGFDPEFPLRLDGVFKTRTRNAVHLLSLNVADWGVSPTHWQQQSLPPEYRDRISIIFDGVDTAAVAPSGSARLDVGNGVTLDATSEVITFVNRNLEPYRGYHVFMRALPRLLEARPEAHVVIIGGDGVSYGASLPEGQTYKQRYLDEVQGSIDASRVHFLGRVPYDRYLDVLRISSVHAYLTYPFVLSWSMIEAMSAGCAVVASATTPVQEVIRDGENGLLFDFFDGDALVDRVCAVLDDPDRMPEMRAAARRTAIETYDLATVCLPRQLELIQTLVSGGRPITDH
ncbi:MAG: glycosyltransferase [Chromatiales bacterium]|jgi:glycosyltransferase involved in cell wall biosynthesis|nr:glycosyltransferase [Chloroflexota bacterium]MBT6274976.1 glycosyltransferase [Chromatiales bacterium]